MNIVYYHSEGSKKPNTVELTPSVVYLRKNIKQITHYDPVIKETITEWSYDEAVLSHSDYAIYAADQNTNDISENQAATAENSDAIIEVSEDADTRITELEDAIIELANSIIEQEG